MSSISSRNVIEFLLTVFAREGLPDELVSDNGPQFVSREFEEFLSSRGIVHRRSAVYNPSCNGEVERFNRTLKHQIVVSRDMDVASAVRNFLFLYRNTRHATTNEAPSKLLHGRVARTKLSPTHAGSIQPVDTATLKEHVAKLQSAYESGYNLRNRVVPLSLKVGDKVRIKKPATVKGRPGYSEPSTITEVLGPASVRVDGQVHNARRVIPVS